MKTKIYSAILMLVAVAALAGCSTPATRIRANPQLFASIAPADQELIRQGQVAIGFTPDMVQLALGRPDAIAQRVDASGTSEIWRYQSFDNSSTVFISGGWGGPAFSPVRGGWGWGWDGAWASPAWGWNTTANLTDFLRVSFRNGRVVEINRLR